MTAIGKLLALLNLVAGLGVLTWSVSVYVQRPGWFDPAARMAAWIRETTRSGSHN